MTEALVVVAHNGKHSMISRHVSQNVKLRCVNILVLVHKDCLVPPLKQGKYFWPVAKQAKSRHPQIIEEYNVVFVSQGVEGLAEPHLWSVIPFD